MRHNKPAALGCAWFGPANQAERALRRARPAVRPRSRRRAGHHVQLRRSLRRRARAKQHPIRDGLTRTPRRAARCAGLPSARDHPPNASFEPIRRVADPRRGRVSRAVLDAALVVEHRAAQRVQSDDVLLRGAQHVRSESPTPPRRGERRWSADALCVSPSPEDERATRPARREILLGIRGESAGSKLGSKSESTSRVAVVTSRSTRRSLRSG